MSTRRLRLLSANIQAGSSTRGYHDYFARSWSHVLPAGNKRGALDTIAQLAAQHDIVGLQESDPGSLRSGFTNQTHYLAERAGFAYWSHQPNRSMGGVASSANGLLSRLEPVSVSDHPLPGRIAGRGVLLARFGDDDHGLTIAVAHLSLGATSRMSQLAFIARSSEGGAPRIWLRPVAEVDARPIGGTDGARSLFWSPDGRSLAFFAGNTLQRLDLPAGVPVRVCAVDEVWSGLKLVVRKENR